MGTLESMPHFLYPRSSSWLFIAKAASPRVAASSGLKIINCGEAPATQIRRRFESACKIQHRTGHPDLLVQEK